MIHYFALSLAPALSLSLCICFDPNYFHVCICHSGSQRVNLSSLAVHLSSCLSVALFRGGGGMIVYVSLNQTWAHVTLQLWEGPKDICCCSLSCLDRLPETKGIPVKVIKYNYARVHFSYTYKRGKTAEAEAQIHQMKRHDNIGTQQYYYKHFSYVSTSISFSPFCLT